MRVKDPLRLTLICWETKNWRHHKKALDWCKNYKLTSLAKTIFIGYLNTKERNRIERLFTCIFLGKTEKYYFFLLHGSVLGEITDKEGEIGKKISKDQPFEIV